MHESHSNVKRLAFLAVMTALVAVLQILGSFIHLGPFSVSLVLIPIVVGAVFYGPAAGAWLGFSFGVVVLISGDAAAFWAISPIGTVLTVLGKGTAAGLCAGFADRLFERSGKTVSTLVAAIVTPIVNTGVFLIGCAVFFLPGLREWATAEGSSLVSYIFLTLVGGNFLFELLFNIILSPVVLRLLKLRRG